ncbi:MAG: diguanylate cyclase [Cellvibrio sp.]|uniref:diguanylate cyclase n=1 Tax=Cellvibrio sp. TaxID=1965322 RepID=UPI0027163F3A|nr:diguanylate cyclase [Cellvibrio sp.]
MFSKSVIINTTLMLSLWFVATVQAQAPSVIRTIPHATDMDRYTLKMLELALSHIDTPYKVQPDAGGQRTQGRYVDDVISGKVDIMWAATDQDLENKLQPVRIPLLKGLLGHRIFLIHKGDQAKFDQVKTFADLLRLKLGQGTTWADTKILEANKLTVVKTNKYLSLLHMLDGGRFDAFPRGVQEPWSEVNSVPGLELEVEKKIMLVYKMPFYLFVNKNNQKLAKDLELGLNRALADGSFDKAFFSDPAIRSAVEKADLKNRLVFQLENPQLPKETPVDRPELWLDVNNLQ